MGSTWFLAALTLGAAALPFPVYILPGAPDLRTVGRLHGQRAAGRVRAFLRLDEVARSVNFTSGGAGAAVLRALRAGATAQAPWLAEEISGIAEGAGASLEAVWTLNLLGEVEAARKAARRAGHCSDVMARRSGGVLLGHNEDWSEQFRPFMYWVVASPLCGAGFGPVGGLVYPGQAPGFAVTFSPTVWTTQNSLFPQGLNQSGIGIIETVRTALRMSADPSGVSALISRPGQAYGMSVQVVGAQAKQKAFGANVEVAGAAGRSAVSMLGANMSHFNGYKHLRGIPAWPESDSSVHRQAAVNRHAVPRDKRQVVDILGDTSDKKLPLYRAHETMFSTVFDSSDGSFSVWYAVNPKDVPPHWNSTLARVFRHYNCSKSALLDDGLPVT